MRKGQEYAQHGGLFTQESLAFTAHPSIRFKNVTDVLTDLFMVRGAVGHIVSDISLAWGAYAMTTWRRVGTR